MEDPESSGPDPDLWAKDQFLMLMVLNQLSHNPLIYLRNLPLHYLAQGLKPTTPLLNLAQGLKPNKHRHKILSYLHE